MKLTKISIDGLFNIFNHEINLKKHERITIIHGPNGYGKTTILRLINSLFKANYWIFISTPFKEFKIYFEDKSYIQIKKQTKLSTKRGKDYFNDIIIFEYSNSMKKKTPGKFIISSDYFSLENDLKQHFDSRFPRSGPFLRYIGINKWFDIMIGDNISTATLIDRYFDIFPDYLKKDIIKSKRQLSIWLKSIITDFDIYFIESQRLYSQEYYKMPFEIESYLRRGPIFSVTKFSFELKQKIDLVLSEYLSKTQSLDHTFPVRLLDLPKEVDRILTEQQIQKEIKELEILRKRLISVGLLSQEESISLPQRKINDHDRNVLSLYIEDIKNKFKVFENFAQKLELLKNIINNRLRHKQMIIAKDRGFIFKLFDPIINKDIMLEPTNLSSGEQHQLVLFYILLFGVKENSLILIDEPEISLHIGWQKKFLKDLSSIVDAVGLDIIIATHSPFIIHDRWDLTEELGD